MADPRLNSVHLEAPRREDFRRARDQLLHARGDQTIAAECPEVLREPVPGSNTLREDPLAPRDVALRFWLIDRDYIYPLRIGLNTIGRSPENDVVLKDAYVSRRHCAILVHAGDGCELHDIASKNGTFLNGRKLTGPSRLAPGDEIRMCDCQLVLMTKSGDDPPQLHTATQTG